jgi:type III secretion system YscQ/HrcQ family protein
MDMALNDALAAENRDREPNGDPAVAKLQSRWKSAVKKASTQLDVEVAHPGFDASDAIESAGVNPLETRLHHDAGPTFPPINTESNPTVPPRAWHAVRPSQVRKVDRQLARMQQAWLAPSICGHCHLNDQPIEWQLSLPQAIVNPVLVSIGYQPMSVDENVELTSAEPLSSTVSAKSETVEPAGFSIAIGADSFLLNWIPAPWRTLSVYAKHALLQVAIAPLVEALGLALGEHWYVVGLEDRREKGDGDVRGVNANSLKTSIRHSALNVSSGTDANEATNVLIGIGFRCAGVTQKDSATLSVPEEWLERFLAARRDATQPYSMSRLLSVCPNIGGMHHRVPVIVGELALDVHTLQQLEIGDVFFFATHHGSLANFWSSKSVKARIDAPSANIELTLDGNENIARVRKVLPRQFIHQAYDFVEMDASGLPHFSYPVTSDKILMKNTSSSNAAPADTLNVSDHLATLPIAITIEVGELSMPLSALSDITVGTTLSLAKPLDDHLLTIRANGHAIAFGELVMLDSEVGVRVKRLSALAAPNLGRSDATADDRPSSAENGQLSVAAEQTGS